jgi:hypothetical protein
MQIIRVTSTAALFLLFGTMVPAFAQHDRKDERQGKPEKPQDRQEQAAPPAAQQQRPQGRAEQP